MPLQVDDYFLTAIIRSIGGVACWSRAEYAITVSPGVCVLTNDADDRAPA